MDPRLTVLLGVYAAILFLNIFISWLQRRQSPDNPAARAQIVVWSSSLALYVLQAIFQELNSWILLPLLPLVVLSFALVRLGETFLEISVPKPSRYYPWIAGLAVLTWVMFQLNVPFTITAFPTIIASQLPVVPMLLKGFGRWSALRFAARMFLLANLASFLLEFTYPILRPIPSAALFGFTAGFSLVIVLSILIPMLVHESVTRGYQETLEREVALRTNQLLESAKFASIGRMAGGVAHEVNSPLAAIQTYAAGIHEAASRGELSGPELQRSSRKILDVIERIARITGALRLISREASVGQRERVAPKPVIDGAIALFADRFARNGVDVSVQIDPACPEITVSSSEIVQVLVGLLSNSIDALQAAQTRWIKIVAMPEAEGLAVDVTDAGRMPGEVAERIMEPLFTTKPLGMGLGLSVGRGIAEAHGGSLRFVGDRANTTFRLWLPAAPSDAP